MSWPLPMYQRGGFSDNTPPGRGFMDKEEIHVAVFGGAADAVSQARALDRLAKSMTRAGVAEAPPIAVLPELVGLASLPTDIDGAPVLGIADDSLGPFAIPAEGIFLVAGPPGSGKSTAVLTTVEAIRRTGRDAVIACIGSARSSIADVVDWKFVSRGPIAGAELARTLVEAFASPQGKRPIDVLVLEGLGELVNSEADGPVLELLHACSDHDVMVIAEGTTNEITGLRPVLQHIRGARHGIALQPEQSDGDMLFKTSFPRINRTEFPVGRGLYVRKGRFAKVHMAVIVTDGSVEKPARRAE